MFTQLANLEDGLANMTRLSNGPLPRFYTLLLHASVWLFLFLLPFQIIVEHGWFTLPVMFVSDVVYFGFLEVTLQIDSPFKQLEELHVKEMMQAQVDDLEHVKTVSICLNSAKDVIDSFSESQSDQLGECAGW